MPILQKLHWLPIRQIIIFKVAELTYKVRATAAPEYLASLLQPYAAGCTLRSSAAPRLFMPPTRIETTKRVFAKAAPNVWNSLPDIIRLSDTTSTLKRRRETPFYDCLKLICPLTKRHCSLHTQVFMAQFKPST
jgi:hypothetical protein